jgi:hypothetical protein
MLVQHAAGTLHLVMEKEKHQNSGMPLVEK